MIRGHFCECIIHTSIWWRIVHLLWFIYILCFSNNIVLSIWKAQCCSCTCTVWIFLFVYWKRTSIIEFEIDFFITYVRFNWMHIDVCVEEWSTPRWLEEHPISVAISRTPYVGCRFENGLSRREHIFKTMLFLPHIRLMLCIFVMAVLCAFKIFVILPYQNCRKLFAFGAEVHHSWIHHRDRASTQASICPKSFIPPINEEFCICSDTSTFSASSIQFSSAFSSTLDVANALAVCESCCSYTESEHQEYNTESNFVCMHLHMCKSVVNLH